MKLLLDTTYLLPAIGISIKNIPKEAVITLIEKGYQVLISEVTIFELSAKGAKYVADGSLPPERICKGIKAILHDDRIEVIPLHDTPILLTAFKIRKVLNDFIDCIILSSAINRADILITEDEDLHNLSRGTIQAIKPRFKVHSLKDILQIEERQRD